MRLCLPSCIMRVHELGDHPVAELRIGQHVSALDFTFAWHASVTSAVDGAHGTIPPSRASGQLLLRSSWLRTSSGSATVLDADRVERAADDVVADAGKILHAAAADEHHRVLLQVVPDAGNVRRHLDAVGEPDAGHLAERRVRLLRGRACRRACRRRASAASAAAPGALPLAPLLRAPCLISWLIVGIERVSRLARTPSENRNWPF